MVYSLAGILSIFIQAIVNIDVVINSRSRKRFRGQLLYLFFVLAVILYHVTDGLWGILYDRKLVQPLFLDTTVYFVAMALSILMFGFFVYQYLGGSKFKRNNIIFITNIVVFVAQIIIIVINIFTPILFEIDKNTCEYSTRPVRYAMLVIQIIIYMVMAVYSLIEAIRKNGHARRHHAGIFVFCIFMTASITLQVFFPLQPMYTLGYLFGVSALHTFVIQDEFARQRLELDNVKKEIMIDPLTRFLNKHAYIEIEASINEKILKDQMEDFAIVIFDLNDLKLVNDTEGHDAGDKYVISAAKFIKSIFVDTRLYRVGGDEFAVVLKGDDFLSKDETLHQFNHTIDNNLLNHDKLVIAAGMSSFRPHHDTSVLQVFSRADKAMYERKRALKQMKQGLNK